MRFLILLIALLASPLRAEPKPDPLYEMRADHDPNGIGKFFMGREIARVVGGHASNEWLERPEREEEEGTDRLIEALDLQQGEVVADIGAGTGYFTWRMARRVGETGKIFAVELEQEALDVLMKNMAKRRVEKSVVPTLGTTTDPKLPRESCDTLLMVDVYHEFDHPYEMIENMIPALKPGGRIVLVEFRKEDPKVPIKEVHKMSEEQVKREMSIHPALAYEQTLDMLPQQHIIIFRKKM